MLLLSNHSLTVSLSFEVGSSMESNNSPTITILHFLALVDSGSSHCFINSNMLRITTFLPNLFLLSNFSSLMVPLDLIFPNPLGFQANSKIPTDPCHHMSLSIPTLLFLPFLQQLPPRYHSSPWPLLFEPVLKMEPNNIHSNLLHLALAEWPALMSLDFRGNGNTQNSERA